MKTPHDSPSSETLFSPHPNALGKLLAIWLKSAPRQPVEPVEMATTVARRGLVGNRHQGGRRQVTVLSMEAWRAAEAALRAEAGSEAPSGVIPPSSGTLDPALRKANLLVAGIDLEDSKGRVLRVGDCRIELRGETKPCRLMDQACPGLQRALEPAWRGGAYGVVLDNAEITVGDPVAWADPSEI